MRLVYIVVPIGIILSAYFIFYFGFYRDWTYGCSGKISFQSFKALHGMNPDRWTCYNGYVEYDKWVEDNQFAYYRSGVHGRLCFSQIDAIKYQLWNHSRSRGNELNRKNEEFKKIINALQDDIDAYKERELNEH